MEGDGDGVSKWAAIVGIALSILGPLLGIIYVRQTKDLAGLKDEVKKLWIEVTALREFKASTAEAERHRQEWREDLKARVKSLEDRMAEMKQADIDWKHDRYGKRMAEVQLAIVRIKDRLKMPVDDDSGRKA